LDNCFQISDNDIVEEFWKRNQKAIDMVSNKYGSFIYKICNNILGNKEDSEECLNDTYLQLWNTIPPSRPDNLKSFSARIARSISINKYRFNNASKRYGQNGNAESLNELLEVFDDGIESKNEEDSQEISNTLNGFLRKVSSKKRTIFIKRYYFSYSIDDISKEMKISKRKLYRILFELREELRDELNKEGLL